MLARKFCLFCIHKFLCVAIYVLGVCCCLFVFAKCHELLNKWFTELYLSFLLQEFTMH